MYRDFCFVPDLIQIIINIVMMGCKQNLNLELRKTFFQEFLQSKMENDSAKRFIETCGDQNYVQIKNHMKWIQLYK